MEEKKSLRVYEKDTPQYHLYRDAYQSNIEKSLKKNREM